jgi:ring-1,2-phenylacetyl-CoA epoxidase subunit PaaE
MAMFYPLTVSNVRRETRDAVVLTLKIPEEHRDAFRFQQGQYLTLRARIDGEEIRRSYSICAATHEPELRVGVKKVPGGLFSTWVNEAVAPGQVLEAMPPMGNFLVPLDPANAKHYVGFASGSGITPLLSIIKTTLVAEPHSSFTLFYGNRASSTIMFREELEDLKSEFLNRFSLVHILSREQQDIDLVNGRITREKCEQLFKYWLDVKTVDTAFICGPQEMMLQVSESLQAHGLDRKNIKFELFAGAEAGKHERAQAPPRDRHPHRYLRGNRNHRRPVPRVRVRQGRGHDPRCRHEGGHGIALCLQGRGLLDLPRDAGGRRRGHGRQFRP